MVLKMMLMYHYGKDFFYINNDRIHFEAPIDIDNRQIKNLGDGNEDGNAVNIKQLNEIETNIFKHISKAYISSNNLDHNGSYIMAVSSADLAQGFNVEKNKLKFKSKGVHEIFYPDNYYKCIVGFYVMFGVLYANNSSVRNSLMGRKLFLSHEYSMFVFKFLINIIDLDYQYTFFCQEDSNIGFENRAKLLGGDYAHLVIKQISIND